MVIKKSVLHGVLSAFHRRDRILIFIVEMISVREMKNHRIFIRCLCMAIVLVCGNGLAGQGEGSVVEADGGVSVDQLLQRDMAPEESELVLEKLTPGEQKWYWRFHDGVAMFDGWNKITNAVVEKFPEHERGKVMMVMQLLGHKIGYEWSRDNKVRRVDTDMLRAWGRDLRKAGAENHVQLARVIVKIDSEMNSLLKPR